MRMPIFKALAELFYPPLCVHCISKVSVSPDLALCYKCLGALKRFVPESENEGGLRYYPNLKPAVASLNALWYFEKQKPVQSLLEELKYRSNTIVAHQLSKLLSKAFKEVYSLDIPEAIVPVPISAKRMRERGYNQSELLAVQLSNALGIPVLKNVLYRNEHQSQTRFNRASRLKNSEDLFVLKNGQGLQERRILILDDVCTTGSTLEALIRAMETAKPQKIDVLVLAITPSPV